MDKCQPHENLWPARKSSQVVNWVKTKPWLAGNQIPFGGTRFGFTSVAYNRGYTYTSKIKSGPLSNILAVKTKFVLGS